MTFNSFLNSYIKHNLISLNEQANDTILKHKNFVETECKSISLQNEENYDSSIQELQKEVDGIHFDVFETYEIKQGNLDISQHILSVSNQDTLWYYLKVRSHATMRYLINSGMNNVLKISAKRQWNRENNEWKTYLSNIDEHINQSLSWVYTSCSDSNRPSTTSKLQNLHNVVSIKPTDRLIITKLTKLTKEKTADKVEELVQLSIQNVDESLKEFCEDIWEILIRLCGKKTKKGSDFNDIKLITYNLIRCLEDLCRRQIYNQLQTPNNKNFNHFFQDNQLFDHLQQFCTIGNNIFLSEASHFWQLAYWSFRCGCISALTSLIALILSNQKIFTDVQEAELLIIMCKLLTQRLHATSRSDMVEHDAIWEHNVTNASEIYAEDTAKLTQRMVDLMEEVRMSPIAILLGLCIQRDKSFIALKTVMPNATVDDFIWYHLTLSASKPQIQLLDDIAQLQKKILDSGPHHFEAEHNSSLAFVKISILVIAPSVGLEWLAKSRPDLIPFCIYCLVYLAQHGITGSEQSIVATNFSNLNKFVGFETLASAFKKYLNNTSTTVIVQLCELLPYSCRPSILSYLLNQCKTELFTIQKESDDVIGYVTSNGECRGGLLFQALIADDWSDEYQDKSKHRERAHSDFVHIVSSLSESAASKKLFVPATIYSYLISQDKLAIQYLIKTFCSPTIFPHSTQSTQSQLLNQQIAKKIYRIIENQSLDTHSDDFASLFTVLQSAQKVASLFEAASVHQYKHVWERMIEEQFFPNTQLVNKWKNSDLIYMIPRLVDIAAQCLRARVGGLFLPELESTESVRMKAKTLIEVYGELPVFVDVQKYNSCLFLLRSLAA